MFMCMCDQICQVCIYYGAICLQIGYPLITVKYTVIKKFITNYKTKVKA